MKIIFSKNNLILSKLIRWGLKEDCSHVGIVFDSGLIFHSNLLGAHLQWFEDFKRHNEIVHELEYKIDEFSEEVLFNDIVAKYDGKTYDFSSFLYFIYRGALWKFFNKPFPSINPYNKKNQFLCTEMVLLLQDSVLPELKGADLSLTSPYKLYEMLNKNKELV